MNGSIKGLQVDFFFQVVVYYCLKGKHLLDRKRKRSERCFCYLRTCDTKPVVKGFL